MDDVVAEEERDVEATLFDGYVLETIDLGGVGDEEEGADGSGADEFIGGAGRGRVERDLGHLAEFFGEGHFGDEFVGEGAGLGIGGRGWDRLGDLIRGYGGPRSRDYGSCGG